MDEQGEETPEVGGISSPSNWRAETLTADPKPKENFFKRLISRFRGNNRVENQSGGPKPAMTQAEADAQVHTEERTADPGETKPAEEESAE